MSDADGLCRYILANPDDDLPRLHWADVVERTDPARAEFVRVQVELARLPPESGQTLAIYGPRLRQQHDTLRRRERELLEVHGFDWGARALLAAPGEHLTRDDDNSFRIWSDHRVRRDIRYAFSRGFVSCLTLSWQDWQTHSAALLAACPLRGKDAVVRLTTWPETFYTVHGYLSLRHHTNITGDGDGREAATLRLLAAAWPGVRFELPQSGYGHPDAYRLIEPPGYGPPVILEPRAFITPPV